MRTACVCVCASARVPCRTSVRAFVPFTSFVAGRQATIHPFFFFEVFEEQEKKRTELNTPLDSRPGSVRSSRRLLAPTVLHRVKKNAEPSDQNVAKKQMSEAWCVRVQQARRQITTARDENDHFYF